MPDLMADMDDGEHDAMESDGNESQHDDDLKLAGPLNIPQSREPDEAFAYTPPRSLVAALGDKIADMVNSDAASESNSFGRQPNLTYRQAQPQSTPESQKVSVVVYRSSKTWVHANSHPHHQHNSTPRSKRRSISVPEHAIVDDEDDESVFNMSRYGPIDRDHSGDEDEDVKATPRSTRRKSIIPPESVYPDFDPITHPRRILTPEMKANMVRDNKGRFASTRPSSMHLPDEKFETEMAPARIRRGSSIVCIPRGKNGKFTSSQVSCFRQVSSDHPNEDIVPPKNTRSKSIISPNDAKLLPDLAFNTIPYSRRMSCPEARATVDRDKNGRFMPSGSSVQSNSGGSVGKKRKRDDDDAPWVPETLLELMKIGLPEQPSTVAAEVGGAGTPARSRRRASSTVSMKGGGASADRDSKGRFKRKTETTGLMAGAVDNNNSPALPTPVEAQVKAVRAKRAPVKSPYFTPEISPPKLDKAKGKRKAKDETPQTPRQRDNLDSEPQTPRREDTTPTASQNSSKRPRTPGGIISCIPFPPLSSPYFGLIQESLAHNPFRLLVAVTFLIRTHGKHAIPVFYDLMSRYPTPEALLAADKEDIVEIIRHLGLQNQRAGTLQMYAKIFLGNPPVKGRRYPVRGYPNQESGRDVKSGEILDDEDPREAWEIGHMTSGPYALDSWRIFCRDRLRGLSDGWNGEGSNSTTSSGEEKSFQPEWMRVLPEDKELRAYLRWMWLKEGYEWDPFTGEKEVASKEMMRAAMEGRLVWDDKGGMRIVGAESVLGNDTVHMGVDVSRDV